MERLGTYHEGGAGDGNKRAELVWENGSTLGKRGVEARRGHAKVDEVREIDVCTGVEGFAKVVEKNSQDR